METLRWVEGGSSRESWGEAALGGRGRVQRALEVEAMWWGVGFWNRVPPTP